VNGLRAWLDRTPLATIALTLARDATGRAEPLEPLRPVRPASLPAGCRIGFWSLTAGAGTTTVAALVAHRSAAGGHAPLLIDLDRWTPSLALRAKLEIATVADALLRPGREAELVSRWREIPFLAGAPGLHSTFDAERIVELVDRSAAGRAAVLDLGSGADALDALVVGALDRLCVVTGTRAGQLQAAFCAEPLVRGLSAPIGLVTVCASDEDARRVASRLPWPLIGAIPFDPFLATDDFAVRAPTTRAVDALIRACA
jgi:hypothetical protein